MLAIVDPEQSGYPVLSLDGLAEPISEAGAQTQPPSAPCPRCEGFRPAPLLDGNLRVDPEIHLPSPGMDVDIAYYYNANASYNGPFGYARTLSTNLFLQALTTSVGEGATLTTVTLFRGNGATTRYTNQGGSSFFYLSSGFFNTLVQDSTNGVWEETTPEGLVSVYPLQSPVLGQTQLSSVSYVQDAADNRHTFSYSGGLLTNLEDAVGRQVTFGYSGGLLQSVQDRAGRFTTFAYDSAGVPGKPLLTTVTGPSGCQIAYGYNTVPLLTGSYDMAGNVISQINPLGSA